MVRKSNWCDLTNYFSTALTYKQKERESAAHTHTHTHTHTTHTRARAHAHTHTHSRTLTHTPNNNKRQGISRFDSRITVISWLPNFSLARIQPYWLTGSKTSSYLLTYQLFTHSQRYVCTVLLSFLSFIFVLFLLFGFLLIIPTMEISSCFQPPGY